MLLFYLYLILFDFFSIPTNISFHPFLLDVLCGCIRRIKSVTINYPFLCFDQYVFEFQFYSLFLLAMFLINFSLLILYLCLVDSFYLLICSSFLIPSIYYFSTLFFHIIYIVIIIIILLYKLIHYFFILSIVFFLLLLPFSILYNVYQILLKNIQLCIDTIYMLYVHNMQ